MGELLSKLCYTDSNIGLLLDKDAVEKRLFVLQQQGYVTASFDDNFTENIPS